MTATLIDDVANGTLTLNPDGSFTYTPNPGFVGTDSFTYRVSDGKDISAVATVTITVTAPRVNQNDVGQFAAVPEGSSGPVSVYNPDGSVAFTLTPFTPEEAPNGYRVAVADINGDGIPDLVAATGPGGNLVRVFDGATQEMILSFVPFEASFTGGLFVAAGDLNQDGMADIVITPDVTGGPRVKIVSGADGSTLADFFGIQDPNFRGGARATLGDINGDGILDLIVSAGFGGGPRIAVFDGATLGSGDPVKLVEDFFAFEQTLRNGAYVGAGDVDGYGTADLIFGGGPTGAPRVLIISGRQLLDVGVNVALASPLSNFFAGSSTDRNGVPLVVKNLDEDRFADLIVGTDADGGGIRAFAGTSLTGGGEPTGLDGFEDILRGANGIEVG